MILLLDVGNTHTHLGLADGEKVRKWADIRTADWFEPTAGRRVAAFVKGHELDGAALACVVPRATAPIRRCVKQLWGLSTFQLTAKTVGNLGIDYPRPETIGADRLANAIAVKQRYGAPAVVVDFGTAVTFDVVNREGNYAGGIIAPGLSALTTYLHEKTALLPAITIREVHSAIGKSTREAMLIGAVHGYRGLIRELLAELKRELHSPSLVVVATGGYAGLMAAKLPEIQQVDPLLTLEGLRLAWIAANR
jgi:type III pantothenate kinase